ncbi:MAG: D-glycero-beta-D-manno-heptose-7-phosphate kinase [Opitutaceae bacterium]|jgi:D-beta-D-heptose 7-phosphate kinase/D-beta-D-heptose 1-phosphate adenosyltransferase
MDSLLSKDQAAAIIGKARGLKILVIGDLMIDEYLWGKVTRISPEAPIPVVEVIKDEFKPGGAANVGLNLLALGAKVFFAGVVGDDENGLKLKECTVALGGDVSAVLADTSRPTTVKTRVIAQHQQVVRVDREKTGSISGELMQALLRRIEPLIDRVDGIIFSDYGKGLLSGELVRTVVSRAAGGKVISVDPKPQNIALFANTSLITPNKKEAEQAVGFALKCDKDVENAALRLQQQLSIGSILITRGDEGMTLLSDGRFLHLPTRAKQVYDVTGAGDSVIGVATLARCAGATMEQAAILSNFAAGISVAHLGVYAVTPEELLAVAGGG